MPDGNLLAYPQNNNFFPEVQGPKGVALAQKLARELVCQQIVYRGITEAAVATELFINNEPGFRLTLPNQAAGIATWKGAAYDLDAAKTISGQILAGTGFFNPIRYGINGENVVLGGAAGGTGFVFAADAPTRSFKCSVTPPSAARILWFLVLDIAAVGPFAAPLGTYDYTGVHS